ncbi:hypothetical protein [Rhodococcus koreensis]
MPKSGADRRGNLADDSRILLEDLSYVAHLNPTGDPALATSSRARAGGTSTLHALHHGV